MRRNLRLAGLAIMIFGWGGLGAGQEKAPVLVELFTSEGCSSCPPADALLERLDQTQPIAGAEVIALSEHVDYWNHIGWADPYSSAMFSRRQEQYARRFRTDGPYTPQMIVDGTAEFVGGDARKAELEIQVASRRPKASVRFLPSPDSTSVMLEIAPLPVGAHKAEVYIAYAADSGISDVLRGENRGRRLHHVSIAKEIKKVGIVDERTGFHAQFHVEKGSRLIAFVQEPGNGPVWGAAMRPANRDRDAELQKR
jgi:hypothetical protein